MPRQASPRKKPSEPPQAARTRSEQKEDTRARVRQAALELFTTVGFDATTTKAVAERAGVASGTVFVHARDKVDLLCMVFYDVLRSATEEGFSRVRGDQPLLEQLLAVFSAIYEAYGDNEKIAGPFVRLSAGSDGPNGQIVGQLTFEFLGRIAALVSDAQARGEIEPTVPPLLLAQNIFALYFFGLMSWISGYATLATALDPGLRMALELQLRGLLRR